MSRTRDGGRSDTERAPPPPLPTWLVVLFLLQLVCNVVMWGAGALHLYRLNEYWMVDSRNMWRVIDRLDGYHQPVKIEGEDDGKTRSPDE